MSQITRLSLLLAWVFVACASEDELVVRDAWIRLAPPGASAAAFATLENLGVTARRIVEVESSQGFEVEIHETVVGNGVASMAAVEMLEIPARGVVELAPRGIHLMLLRPPAFREHQRVLLWLRLDDGTRLALEATVRKRAPER